MPSIERARSVWRAYFAAAEKLFSGGSSDVTDLKPYLTAEEYEATTDALRTFLDKGYRFVGERSTRGFEVEKVSSRTVVALVCVENGDSTIVDHDGKNITPASRRAEFTLRLAFVIEGGKVLLDKDQSWSGNSAC